MNSFTMLLFLLSFPFQSGASLILHKPDNSRSLYRRSQNSTDITQLWGPYSPFFSVPSEISSDIPAQCRLSFVQILSRHGARDPTASKTAEYARLVTRIQANVKNFTGDFAFLANYTYALGADQLTLFGQQEMVDSGVAFYNRYQNLTRSSTPFFRSSGEARVVESAQNFTQGFHQARAADPYNTSADPYPYPILVISEAPGVNNTLSHSLCTAFENSTISNTAVKTFLSTFAPPITTRLNAALPGANLSNTDTLALMDLCPFTTIATAPPSPHTPPPLSPFCTLFAPSEWTSYSALQSLSKHDAFGPSAPLGPTQGVGFANELLARLTSSPVHDHTSSNRTLDGSNATFPLGSALYADFSHDGDMTAVFFALGLYHGLRNGTALVVASAGGAVGGADGYSASTTVPFAARAYFEKMVCAGAGGEVDMVRVVVNDRVLPLVSFGADARGLVPLGRFVDAMSFVRSGGEWNECFAQAVEGCWSGCVLFACSAWED